MKSILYCLAGYVLYSLEIIDNYELIFWGFVGLIDVLESNLDK